MQKPSLRDMTDQQLAEEAGRLTGELVGVMAEVVRRHPEQNPGDLLLAGLLNGMQRIAEQSTLAGMTPVSNEVQ